MKQILVSETTFYIASMIETSILEENVATLKLTSTVQILQRSCVSLLYKNSGHGSFFDNTVLKLSTAVLFAQT